METEACEVLYRLFRTASEYIDGYHTAAPYPESFAFCEAAGNAGLVNRAEAGYGTADDFVAAGMTDTERDGSHVEYTGKSGGVNGTGYTETPAGSFAPLRSMQEVYAAVARCAACALGGTRTKPVAGEGPEELSRLTNSVEVMVIGEGPGADEDRQGRPFVGRAGQLLDKMLEAIQLSRKTNCYITNVVKCRPPHNRDPAPEERHCCAAFLDAQLRLTKPKIILAMGRIAAQHLLQTSDGIGKLRGRFFDYHGIPLMPTYHPSALLRDEGLKRPAWEDLKRFRARLQELRLQG